MVQLPAMSSTVAWGDLWVAPRGKAVCTMTHQQGKQPVFWLWVRSSKAPQSAKEQVRTELIFLFLFSYFLFPSVFFFCVLRD